MKVSKSNTKISGFYSFINEEFEIKNLLKTEVMAKGFFKALRAVQTKHQAISTLSALPVDLKPLFSEAWKISTHEPTVCLNLNDFLFLWCRYSNIERIDFDFSFLKFEHLISFLDVLKKQFNVKDLFFIEEFFIPLHLNNSSMQLAC